MGDEVGAVEDEERVEDVLPLSFGRRVGMGPVSFLRELGLDFEFGFDLQGRVAWEVEED